MLISRSSIALRRPADPQQQRRRPRKLLLYTCYTHYETYLEYRRFVPLFCENYWSTTLVNIFMVSVILTLESYALNVFVFRLIGWLACISISCNVVILRLECRLGASLYSLLM